MPSRLNYVCIELFETENQSSLFYIIYHLILTFFLSLLLSFLWPFSMQKQINAIKRTTKAKLCISLFLCCFVFFFFQNYFEWRFAYVCEIVFFWRCDAINKLRTKNNEITLFIAHYLFNSTSPSLDIFFVV